MPLIVAVTGATGAQGGATARALLARGHQVRALTRTIDSPAAHALRALGAEPYAADFDDRASLDAALAGADSLFAVSTPFGTDISTEVKQGIALIDAAQAVGVGHVVFTSAAHAERQTHVPHYDSKRLIEQHLRTAGVPWTVIGPAAFMDNLTSGWTLDGLRSGTYGWPLPTDQPLTWIPSADIGAFAALVISRRADFLGARIDIASDELTAGEQAAILTAVTGKPIVHEETPLEIVRRYSTDLAAMFSYFRTSGLDIDTASLRREFPEVGWHSFADWTATQDWPALFSAPPSRHH